jgi:PAS domain S-box-containing protein
MTAAPPSASPEQRLAGLDLRSVLAPAPFSRVVLLGAGAALALAALEAIVGAELLIAGLLVLPPLVVALTGRWGDTVAVAVLVVALVAASPAWHDDMGAPDHLLVSLLLVLAGGAVAVVVAAARTGSSVALARFRLLAAVGDASGRPTQGEFTAALRELLVPSFADEVHVTLSDAAGGDGVTASTVRVPLRSRGRVLGDLTCSLRPSERRYSAADRRFAEALAGRVALALDNAGLTHELSVAEEQMSTALRTLAEAVTITDGSGRMVYANDAAVELLRAGSREDLLDADPGEIMARYDVFDEKGRVLRLDDFPSARTRAGEAGVKPMLVRNVVRATGEERWLVNKITPLRDEHGAITRIVSVIEDVTEVKHAERVQAEIAEALQHGLLPPELPEVPGWAAAVLYRPAGELTEVGGDFYDVFEGPGSWMVVIGDIAGRGAEAATRTSLARFTVRTAAELTGDVGLAVRQLNDTLRQQAGLPICTVVCASVEERPDGTALLTMASAGHPPPLLIRGGSVRPVGVAGTIAGAFDGEDWPAASVELAPGDVLVFYTDGVLDAVGEGERFGEGRLREALGGLGGTVEERVAALGAALDAFQCGPQRDDTTALVLEYRGAAAADAAAGGAHEVAR